MVTFIHLSNVDCNCGCCGDGKKGLSNRFIISETMKTMTRKGQDHFTSKSMMVKMPEMETMIASMNETNNMKELMKSKSSFKKWHVPLLMNTSQTEEQC